MDLVETLGVRRWLQLLADREDRDVRHALLALAQAVAPEGVAGGRVEEIGDDAGAVPARGLEDRRADSARRVRVVDNHGMARGERLVDQLLLAPFRLTRVAPEVFADGHVRA